MSIQDLRNSLEEKKIKKTLVDILYSRAKLRYECLGLPCESFKEHSTSVEKEVLVKLNYLNQWIGGKIKRKDNYQINFNNLIVSPSDGINIDYKNFLITYFQDLIQIKNPNQSLVIAMGSNIGYCGDFNRRVLECIRVNNFSGNSIIAFGKKIRRTNDDFPFIEDILLNIENRTAKQIKNADSNHYLNNLDNEIKKILNHIFSKFNQDNYTSLSLIYNNSGSRKKMTITSEMLFPLDSETIAIGTIDFLNRDFKFEPNPETYYAKLILYYLKIKLLSAFFESAHEEQYQRMISTASASEKIEEDIIVTDLNIKRTRKKEITKHIIEIMGSMLAIEESELEMHGKI